MAIGGVGLGSAFVAAVSRRRLMAVFSDASRLVVGGELLSRAVEGEEVVRVVLGGVWLGVSCYSVRQIVNQLIKWHGRYLRVTQCLAPV